MTRDGDGSPGGGASHQAMMKVTSALAAKQGEMAIADLVGTLSIPRSTLYSVIRAMIGENLLENIARGRVRLSRLWLDMALRREDAGRDASVANPEVAVGLSLPPVSRSFLWNPVLTGVSDCSRFRKPKPYKIGFSNGSRSNHWRQALVDEVERRAMARTEICDLVVLHADDDVDTQRNHLKTLGRADLDIVLVSPVDRFGVTRAIKLLSQAGTPVVMVDRMIDDDQAYITHVFSADASIGRIPAQWLVERLNGQGGILMLAGMEGTTPVEQRSRAALEVFETHSGIDVLDLAYTGWTREGGRTATAAAIERYGDRIAGVWCDSGQQGVGSLDAFIAAGRSGRIPYHTGGDINAMYQDALRLSVPMAAIDYPPSMGSRAVDICIDILSGERVLRRVEIDASVIVTRGFESPSVRADIYVEDHVRWDRPRTYIMGQQTGGASGRAVAS
jgi:ABC-type sugar transport system substrate-binding protein